MRTTNFIVLVPTLHIVASLVNLSENKSADMSTSQYSDKWLADEAVDGDVSQDVQDNSCAVTLYGFTPEAWWRVDLGDVYVVNSVRIYNRKEKKSVTYKLSGISFYVSETPKWRNGILCYQDNNGLVYNPGPSDVITLPCNATGRYVTLYKERKGSCLLPNQPQYCVQFELCEVQIFGCENGTYGASCENNCTGNCLNDETCNKSHGGCDNGCTAGYDGFRCDKACKTGFFGLNCKSSCGQCFNSFCNNIDGSCPRGCIAGWKGFYCNESCDTGTYGVNCEQECSQHCSTPGQCYSTNGTCYGGCQSGWMNGNCNQSCPVGRFGPNCESNCSAYCVKNYTCNRKTGFCEGCTEGWMGHFCNQTCDIGEFGRDCLKSCATCRNSSCNSTNGLCNNGCIDGYNGTFCNISVAESAEAISLSPRPNIAVYVGTAIGCAVVVAVLILVLVVFKRKSFIKTEHNVKAEWRKSRMILDFDKLESPKGFENLVMTEMNTTPEYYIDAIPEDENRYYNHLIVKDIPILDLPDVIRSKKEADSYFADEFKYIGTGEESSCDIARLPANIPKNRYKNMFPYDHSRVILKDVYSGETDYINASYIKDVDGKISYIACQGPKQTTLREHWRMIWQEEIDTIVILTNLKEGNKIKCHQYWPDTRLPLTTGHLIVTNTGERKYPFYIVRELSVYDKQTSETREIQQFHFTEWLDHSTPDPLELMTFYRRVVSSQTQKPMLVHCSAGLGRTGVFIALDALMKNSRKTGTVNIFVYVQEMRKDRKNMVQTLDQYIFVHEALQEGLHNKDHTITKSDFLLGYQEYIKSRTLISEFQELQSRDYKDSDYVAGKKVENEEKNYSQGVLPKEAFSVKLLPTTTKQSNYINAVFVPSYMNKKEFIVTQLPLTNTSEDFWRMISEQESSALVILEGHSATDAWLPGPNTNLTIGQFCMVADTEIIGDKEFSQYKISLKNKQCGLCGGYNQSAYNSLTPYPTSKFSERTTDSSLVVKVFKANLIKKNKSSQDPNTLLSLLQYVFAWRRQSQFGPLTVLSSDGAVGCGVFCALYAIITQLQHEEKVDIYTIVRQLQKRRPELCSSLEEYESCYSTTAHYIKYEADFSSCDIPEEKMPEKVYVNTTLM